MEQIKVGVMGACGRMGKEICRSIIDEPGLQLTAAFDVINTGSDIGTLVGKSALGITIQSNLSTLLDNSEVDVIVDFTNAQALLNNIPKVIKQGINVVIGTTGLTNKEIAELEKLAIAADVGIFMAPNFAIGAVLMMRFAQQAAKYLPNIEIIEMHHDQKVDAPSGTALKTLEEISKARKPFRQGAENEYEKIPGVRGGDFEGIRVHSIRLPGLVAHQEVLMGGIGQTLSIRHDSLTRESFMPGIMLAIKKVVTWKGLIFGLEHILD